MRVLGDDYYRVGLQSPIFRNELLADKLIPGDRSGGWVVHSVKEVSKNGKVSYETIWRLL